MPPLSYAQVLRHGAPSKYAKRSQGRRKALVIGINYSTPVSQKNGDYLELYAPRKDARAFGDLLTRRYGYNTADVTVMLDEGDHDLLPTRANMIREITNLVRDAKSGDRFVFYYAGHADQIETKSFSEEDGLDEVILPMDHDGLAEDKLILDHELRRLLVDPLPDGAHLTAIFDSCHSGTLLDLDHYECNEIFRPWVSQGRRRSDSRWILNIRRNAVPMSPRIYQRRANGPALRSREVSIDDLVSTIGQPRRAARSASGPDPARTKPARTSGDAGLARWRSAGGLKLRASVGALMRQATDVAAVEEIPQCLSPIASRVCNGWCERETGTTAQASVVSLAACKDAQNAWEDGSGRSMTQMLIEILDGNPNLSFKELMTTLSFGMHTMARSLHEWTRRKRRERAARRQSTAESSCPGELVNFQDPQLGSQTKLDLNTQFTM